MSLLLLAALALAAAALDSSASVVPWSELGLSTAAEDAMVRGPELLHAGPGGRLALWDGVRRELVILEGDTPTIGIPMRHASDLLLLDDALLVLDHAARQLQLWSLAGEPLASSRLPSLVPTSVILSMVGDQVGALDLFGNRHPVATLCGDGLEAPRGSRLEELDSPVRWADGVMRTEGFELPLPEAIQASGQRLGDWLVVDRVVDEAPLVVEREAWHIPSRDKLSLPVEGRLYAPRGDVAVTPEGELVVILPWEHGLEILRVKP